MTLWLAMSTAAWANEGPSVRVTSGWLSVVDVKDVQSVTSADATRVSIVSVSEDQVLLLGAEPGETTISVWSGPARAPQRTDYPVVVVSGDSLQPFDGVLKVSVDDRRTVHARSLKRIAIGDASICDAVLTGPDAFVLVPRRPGRTSMLVWTGGDGAAHRKQLLVTVESGGISRTVDELDTVLTEPVVGRLVLIAGEHAIVDVPAALRQFTIVDSTVAAVRVGHPGEVIVEARAAGATSLLVWTGKSRPESLFVVVHPRAPWEPEDQSGDAPATVVPVRKGL